jgi:hypothetical protein
MSRAQVFYQCGGCGAFHPASFTGDCRDDFNRFNAEDLPDGACVCRDCQHTWETPK